jgi:hypothetical protein
MGINRKYRSKGRGGAILMKKELKMKNSAKLFGIIAQGSCMRS